MNDSTKQERLLTMAAICMRNDMPERCLYWVNQSLEASLKSDPSDPMLSRTLASASRMRMALTTIASKRIAELQDEEHEAAERDAEPECRCRSFCQECQS